MPEATSEDATVYVILGMHRSGTSATARLLNLLGVYLGPREALVEPQAGNPRGFWEYEALTNLNEELLHRFGGDYSQPSLPAGWVDSPRARRLVPKAKELIARDFARSTRWGWKDPRVSLTLPFWRPLLPQMRFIVCFRNPIDAARSLEARDRLPLRRGLKLWTLYTASALVHTAGSPRLIVSYEELLDDWRSEAQRIASFISVPPGRPDEVAEEVTQFLDPALSHHRTAPETALEDPKLPSDTRFLYLMLLLHSPEVGDVRGVSPERRKEADEGLTSAGKIVLDDLGTPYHRALARVRAIVMRPAPTRRFVRKMHTMPVRFRRLLRRPT